MHRSGLAALLCAIALFAAACGGSNDSSDSDDERSRASDTTLPDTTEAPDSVVPDTEPEAAPPTTAAPEVDLAEFEDAAAGAAMALEDPDDPRSDVATDLLVDCLAQAGSEQDDGVELLEEIAGTVTPDGLSEPAAVLAAGCFIDGYTAEVFRANSSADSDVEIPDDEVDCAVEVNASRDFDALVDALMDDIQGSTLDVEDRQAVIACLSDATLSAVFTEGTGEVASDSETRCFYDELAVTEEVTAESLDCLSAEALRGILGQSVEQLDLTDDELRCSLEGLVLDQQGDSNAAGREYAGCGVFGRTLNASTPDIDLSPESVDWVDEALINSDTNDNTALTEALTSCLTDEEWAAVSGEIGGGDTTDVDDGDALVADAVAALDGDPDDPMEDFTVETLTECLAARVGDAGVAELLTEIAAAEPGDGLSLEAATLTAECLDATITTETAMMFFDGIAVTEEKAQCMVDGYFAADPQVLIDNLQADVTDGDPGPEATGNLLACLDGDDKAALAAQSGLDLTPDEATCFFDVGDPSESATSFEDYAACGVSGRLYALGSGVDLSAESVACLDDEFPNFSEAEADDALILCLTDAELAMVGLG